MYRIYETHREEFAVTWHSMMAQCLPESSQKLNDAIATAESTAGRLDVEVEILTLKNQRLWCMSSGSGRSGRTRHSSPGLGAEHSGPEAGANRAREQHRLAQVVDEHGAHACLALEPCDG